MSCSINVNSARTSGETSVVSGLPFTAATATNMINSVSFYEVSTNFTGSNIPIATIPSNTSNVLLYKSSGTNINPSAAFTAGQTGSINFSVTYITA